MLKRERKSASFFDVFPRRACRASRRAAYFDVCWGVAVACVLVVVVGPGQVADRERDRRQSLAERGPVRTDNRAGRARVRFFLGVLV